MALFTVSKPKPECSRSNSTKSQPADFMIWPMPGVANSTMKWLNFAAFLPAMALRPRLLMIHPSTCSDPVGPANFFGRVLGGRAFADQIVFADRLVRDERRARF